MPSNARITVVDHISWLTCIGAFRPCTIKRCNSETKKILPTRESRKHELDIGHQRWRNTRLLRDHHTRRGERRMLSSRYFGLGVLLYVHVHLSVLTEMAHRIKRVMIRWNIRYKYSIYRLEDLQPPWPCQARGKEYTRSTDNWDKTTTG